MTNLSLFGICYSFGIYVENNTLMADIGNCQTGSPAGNGWPTIGGGAYPSSPVSGWDSPNNWTSIYSSDANTWEYQPYENEFVGYTNGITDPVNSTLAPNPNTGFLGDCNNKLANNITTCPLNASVYFATRTAPSEDDENNNVNNIDESVIVDGLGNAYPNPANNTFIIPYNIEHHFGNAKIEIFDLKSSKAVAIKHIDNTKGEVTFTTETLQEGIYMYRLIIDGEPFKSKNVVIIK